MSGKKAKPVTKTMAKPVIKPAPVKKSAASSKAKGELKGEAKAASVGTAKKPVEMTKNAKAPALHPKKGMMPTPSQEPTKQPGSVKKRQSANTGSASGSLTTLSRQSTPARAGEHFAAGTAVCREVACELMATTGGYCRMHYIKNWKKVKRKEMILKERKLNSYIEELVSKYPDKYIEAIRQDLASEKDFAKVIADLEIEEGLDDFETVETESAEGIIDNLKREFDDEGDVF